MKKFKNADRVTFSQEEAEELFNLNCHHFVRSNNINTENTLIAFASKEEFEYVYNLWKKTDPDLPSYAEEFNDKDLMYVILIKNQKQTGTLVSFFSKEVISMFQIVLENLLLEHPEFFEYNTVH